MVKGLTTKQFIERAEIKHNNKYDYSRTWFNNMRTKICIICPEHGEFYQKAHSHVKGHGCPNCYKTARKSTEISIEQAKKTHSDKYDYSKVNT